MKKFKVNIVINYELDVYGINEDDARDFALERLMDNPTRYAKIDVEKIDEEE